MELTGAIFFWASLGLLFVTKAADVWTTIRHVGPRGESNPLARAWFERLGFGRGIAAVCVLFSVVAAGQYVLVWEFCGPGGRLLNAVAGLAVAWVQWDVARFNAGRRHSRITRAALRAYEAWGRRWRR